MRVDAKGIPLCGMCWRPMVRDPKYDHAGKIVFACRECDYVEMVEPRRDSAAA